MIVKRRAESTDAAAILALRHAAEDWLASRSIDQWKPREIPLSTIDQQVARGEFIVGLEPQTQYIVAAMRLMWSDPAIWTDDEDALRPRTRYRSFSRRHRPRNGNAQPRVRYSTSSWREPFET